MRRTTPSELVIRQRLRTLTRSLPAAQRGDVASLHQARVATRRLREALPLLSPAGRQRRARRAIRRLTQAMGPIRELDVASQTLDELEHGAQVPKAAIARLREAVLDERGRLSNEMQRRLDRCDLDKLRKRLVAAARKARKRTPRTAELAEERAARRALRLQAAIDAAGSIYLPDRLHEVRIAVKKLRYSLELVSAFRRAPSEARVRALKKTQDLLGRMHDLEVLVARTRAVQGAAYPPTLKLSAELDELVRRLETECRQLHSRYVASRQSLLSICDHVRTEATRRRRAA